MSNEDSAKTIAALLAQFRAEARERLYPEVDPHWLADWFERLAEYGWQIGYDEGWDNGYEAGLDRGVNTDFEV